MRHRASNDEAQSQYDEAQSRYDEAQSQWGRCAARHSQLGRDRVQLLQVVDQAVFELSFLGNASDAKKLQAV